MYCANPAHITYGSILYEPYSNSQTPGQCMSYTDTAQLEKKILNTYANETTLSNDCPLSTCVCDPCYAQHLLNPALFAHPSQ